MLRLRYLLVVALTAPLAFPAVLVAERSYDPQLLPTMQAAIDQLRELAPQISPVKINGFEEQILQGYYLSRMEVGRQDLKLYFTRLHPQKIEFYPNAAAAPPYEPFSGDQANVIDFAHTTGFRFMAYAKQSDPKSASWCFFSKPEERDSRSSVCLTSEAEMYRFLDAVSTLIVAAGGHLEPTNGFSSVYPVDSNYLRKNRAETGCEIEWLARNSVPEKAGIRRGDILHSVNGKPYTCVANMLGSAFTAKPGEVVNVEIYSNHKLVPYELRYPLELENSEQLRQQGKQLAEAQPSAQAVAVHSRTEPVAGQRFGIEARPVNDADIAALKLPKPRGLFVVDVEKGALADKMGLQTGDVINEVNNSEIGDIDLFAVYAKSGAVKKMKVWRKGQSLELTIPQSM